MLTTEQIIHTAPHCRGQHQENSTKYKERDPDVMASSLTFLAPGLVRNADGSPCPRNHRQLRVGVAAGDCPEQRLGHFILAIVGTVRHSAALPISSLRRQDARLQSGQPAVKAR